MFTRIPISMPLTCASDLQVEEHGTVKLSEPRKLTIDVVKYLYMVLIPVLIITGVSSRDNGA